jgi:hypothetical protein
LRNQSAASDGVPTGEYEDFMTGFVVNDSSVWGRPVGVAVAHDGALLVSEDGNGTMWRVSYRGVPLVREISATKPCFFCPRTRIGFGCVFTKLEYFDL